MTPSICNEEVIIMDQKRKALLDNLQAYRVWLQQGTHGYDKIGKRKLVAIINRLTEQLDNLD